MQSLFLNGLKHLATLSSGIGKQKKILILIYHRVLDEPDFMRPGEVDRKVFSWHMELLAKYFNVLPLADALEQLHKDSLPSRAVCITFDDGYADNCFNALPILKQNQLTATFFIASGYLNGGRMWNDTIIETLRDYSEKQLDLSKLDLGLYNTKTNIEKEQAAGQIIKKIKHLEPQQRQEYTDYIADTFAIELPDNLMLTNDQLLNLYQKDMEIGGHTVTHPIMAKTEKKILQAELEENKSFLESLMNNKIRYFAYPNGKPGQDYLPEQVDLVKDSGYLGAVSTEWGVAIKTSDVFQLPRFTPWDNNPIKFMIRMILRYRAS